MPNCLLSLLITLWAIIPGHSEVLQRLKISRPRTSAFPRNPFQAVETPWQKKYITIPEGYNKDRFPPGEPTKVAIKFSLSDVTEVDDNEHTLTIKLNIGMAWSDERLSVNPDHMSHLVKFSNGTIGDYVLLDLSMKDKIWTPSLTSMSLQEFKILKTFRPLEHLYLTPEADSLLYYEVQTLISFTCSMNFNQFPFDRHKCLFQVGMDVPLQSVQFTQDTDLTDDFLVDNVLEFKFGFKKMSRKVTTYVFNYYIPTGLFVIVSWMSFVIPPDSVPARITMIITTFLVLINVANSAFTMSPISSRINPIQIWILVCMTFVFATILEYASILMYERVVIRKIYVTRKKIQEQGLCQRPMKNDMVGITENSMMILLAKIDFTCLAVSFFLFFMFNCVYWTIA